MELRRNQRRLPDRRQVSGGLGHDRARHRGGEISPRRGGHAHDTTSAKLNALLIGGVGK